MNSRHSTTRVIPAKAGTQEKQGALQPWVPAFAGMTIWGMVAALPQGDQDQPS